MKKLVLFLFILISLSSCTISTHFIEDGAKSYAPTQASNIKVYSSLNINKNYVVIGSIAADAVGNSEDALEALKEEAALIGADAVVDVKLTKISSGVDRTGLSGVAVKFK